MGSIAEKFALARRCRHQLANWPEVLAQVAASRLGLQRRPFNVVSAGGVALQSPNRPAARWPLLEVVVSDVYRLRDLAWEDPSRSRVVLDVGAHVGSFTCALAAHLPGAKLVCVEPSPASITWLRKNLAHNGLVDRAVVIEAAVTESDGDFALSEPDGASGSTAVVTRSLGAPNSALKVRGMRFDSLIANLGSVPQIVKIDCEGGEYPAILGSSAESWVGVEEVFMEYHPVAGHGFSELRARLEVAGLDVVWNSPDPRRVGLGMAYFRSRKGAAGDAQSGIAQKAAARHRPEAGGG